METTKPNSLSYISIIGGILIEIVCGSVFMTGNNLIYLSSHLQNQGHHISTSDLTLIVPFQVLGLTFSIAIGSYLVSKFSPRISAFISLALWTIPLLLLPSLTNLYLIILVYGVIYTVCLGIQFIIPLIVGWSNFPQYKGRVAGIVLTGFGFGPFFFNPIMTYAVNPENLQPNVLIEGEKYFGRDVSDRFQDAIFIVVAALVGINLIGIALLFEKKGGGKGEEGDLHGGKGWGFALRTRCFWMMAFMVFLSISGDFYMIGNFKIYGKDFIKDDMFLALVGSISALFDGCTRSLWGYLFDKFSFKTTYSIILCIQTITFILINYVGQFKILYLICVALLFGAKGAHYILFTAESAHIFGKNSGAHVFSMLCYFFAFGTFFAIFIHKMFLNYIGYGVLFLLFALMSIGSGVLLLFFDEKVEHNDLELELVVLDESHK